MIILMATTAGVSIRGLQAIQHQLETIVDENEAKVELVAELRKTNRNKLIALQQALLVDDVDTTNNLLAFHSEQQQIYEKSYQTLYSLAQTTAEQDILSEILDISQQANRMHGTVKHLATGMDKITAQELHWKSVVPAQNDVQYSLDRLIGFYKLQIEAATTTTNNRLLQVKHSVFSLAGLVTLLCLLIAYRVFLTIHRSEQHALQNQQNLESMVKSRTTELAEEVRIRRLAERKSHNEHKRLAATLASISDSVITVNSSAEIDYVNHSAEILLGKCNREIRGSSFSALLQLKSDKTGHLISFDELTNNNNFGTHLQLQSDNELVDVHCSITEIYDDNPRLARFVVVLRDISESKALSRQLEHEATHDSLTGLINRREFERRIEQALNKCNEYDIQQTFCFIDLDRFKQVNDSCGHAAGDALLQEISKRVSNSLSSDDTLARIGGDEFGVILNNCDAETGISRAENIKTIVQSYQLNHNNKMIGVGASIGVVEINSTIPNMEELLRMADTACYLAKENGRDCVSLYKPENQEIQKYRSELDWSAKIKNALDTRGFKFHCQPIQGVSSEHAESTHYEVLLRMIGQEGELVYPGTFLPAAERHGLMVDIDRYVIQHTFEWLASNPQHSASGRFSINLHSDSISDQSFLSFVIDVIESTEICMSSIIFEITEAAAVNNLDNALVFMTALSELGCEFALDDFGKGFSSLTSLKDLPVDYLKIDGGFIKDLLDNQTDEATVKAIIELARALEKQTVAEFVESTEIRDKLTTLGVDYVQGFGIARPAAIGTLFGQEENQSAINASLDKAA